MLTYRDAGVDIDQANQLVERIKTLSAATRRPEVVAGVGGFASLVQVPTRYQEPLLVSGTDGVGTKLKLASAWNRHEGIGQDLVAMCVNDILVVGAEPLFFLDYFASARLDPKVAELVIAGIAAACQEVGCALVGGETAEMPGMYAEGEYDLAGFVVGVVEHSALIDGARVQKGDLLLGLASSGPHANGFSLIRRILAQEGYGIDPERDAALLFDGMPLRDACMAPTRLYVRSVRQILNTYPGAIKAMAHITGGGITENLPRVLPADYVAAIELSSWRLPQLFAWLAEAGALARDELLRVFNCGIGMILVVDSHEAGALCQALVEAGETVYAIGAIEQGSGPARVCYSGSW